MQSGVIYVQESCPMTMPEVGLPLADIIRNLEDQVEDRESFCSISISSLLSQRRMSGLPGGPAVHRREHDQIRIVIPKNRCYGLHRRGYVRDGRPAKVRSGEAGLPGVDA